MFGVIEKLRPKTFLVEPLSRMNLLSAFLVHIGNFNDEFTSLLGWLELQLQVFQTVQTHQINDVFSRVMALFQQIMVVNL